MSFKLLQSLQPAHLSVVLITSVLPLADIARALPSSLAASPLTASTTQLSQAEPQIQASPAGPAAANFVPQNLLRAVNQLSTTTTPALPGLGYPDRFLPAPDPLAKTRLVIKLGERRVYVYHEDEVKQSFPVAIGRDGWETPIGTHRVIQMQHDPVWQHPFTGELVPPGKDNPLGARWIGFWTDGTNYIGFHGTPNEESVGQPASHGCVRMYNRDVIKLFEMVRIGTSVEVVP